MKFMLTWRTRPGLYRKGFAQFMETPSFFRYAISSSLEMDSSRMGVRTLISGAST